MDSASTRLGDLHRALRHQHSDYELQPLIDRTEPGDTLELPVGEFIGPIYLTKPLTIQGKGERTTIWTPNGSVVVVFSAGVALRNLRLEQTVQHDTPHVIYAGGDAPTLDLPASCEIVSESMNQERLIDLDRLGISEQINVPIELPADSRWNSMHLENLPAGRIEPLPINSHHSRGAMLHLQVPDEPGYLFTPLVLVDTQQNTTQRYLVKAEIRNLDNPPMVALESDLGSTIYFNRYLDLDSVTLYYMMGRVPEQPPVRYATIIPSNTSNNRSLWIPCQDVQSGLLFNKNPLPPWHRRLLQEGDQITIDGYTLTVRQKKSGPLEFSQFECNFQTVSAPEKVICPLTIRKTNQMARSWKGKVRALVPWIDLDSTLEIHGMGKSELTIDISLNADEFSRLSNGVHLIPSAIVIYNDDAAYFLAARIDVQIADFDVRYINPIEFQAPDDLPFYAEALAGRETSFYVENRGRADAHCQLDQIVDWLELADHEDRDFVLPAQEQREIVVWLSSLANNLAPTRLLEEPAALTISVVDGNAPVVVPAHIEGINEARKAVFKMSFVGPADQEFNKYLPHLDDVSVKLLNRGNAVGYFDIEVEGLDHAVIDPVSGELAPNGIPQICSISFADAYEELRRYAAGYTVPVDIVVNVRQSNHQSSKAARKKTTIDIVDRRPRLTVGREVLDLGEVGEGMTTDFNATITATNAGDLNYVGGLEMTITWLQIAGIAYDDNPIEAPPSFDRLRLDLAPNQTLRIKLQATGDIADLAVGTHDVADAVRFTLFEDDNDRIAHTVSATVTIVSRLPAPHLLRPNLWFEPLVQGVTNQKFPESVLEIGNYGYGDWEATLIRLADWLSIPSLKNDWLVIPSNTILKLPVCVTQAIVNRPAGTLTDPAAIQLRGTDGTEFSVSARCILQARIADIMPKQAALDFGDVLIDQSPPIAAELLLRNQGSLDWRIRDVDLPRAFEFRAASPVVLANGENMHFQVILDDPSAFQTPGPCRDQLTIHGDDGQQVTVDLTFEVILPHVIMAPAELEVSARSTQVLVREARSSPLTPVAILSIFNHTNAWFCLVSRADNPADVNFIIPNEVQVTINNPAEVQYDGVALPDQLDIPPNTTLELQVKQRSRDMIGGPLSQPFELRLPRQETQLSHVLIS